MSVPALRFKEFNENDAHHNAFKSFVIKDVANIQVGRDLKEDSFSETQTAKHKFPVYSNTVEKLGLYGFYDFEEYDGNSLTVVGRGAGLGTAFARSSGFAAIGRLLVISPKSNEFNVKYFAEYVNFKLQIHNESGGIPQLPGSTFGMYSIVLPSIAEQTKIANFLKVVDEKITQLTQKHDLLTQYKKGVMQQIFSQELRFKDDDGQDFPEWEDTVFGDAFEFVQTNSHSREMLTYESGEVKNIHYGDIHKKFKSNFRLEQESVPYLSATVDVSKIKLESYCKSGDIVVADASEDYADVGKAIEIIEIGDYKLVAGLHTYIARDRNNKMALGFGGYLMQSEYVRTQIKVLATGVSVLSISKGNLGKVKVQLPNKPEQTKIANFLTTIDDKITATQTQLQAVKQYKQGLLQQMFV